MITYSVILIKEERKLFIRNLVALVIFLFLLSATASHAEVSPELAAMKKIMAKHKATGGNKGPIGPIKKDAKLTRVARSEKEMGFYLEFSRAVVVTSPKGTYYFHKAVFAKWLENYPVIGYPTSDPHPLVIRE